MLAYTDCPVCGNPHQEVIVVYLVSFDRNKYVGIRFVVGGEICRDSIEWGYIFSDEKMSKRISINKLLALPNEFDGVYPTRKQVAQELKTRRNELRETISYNLFYDNLKIKFKQLRDVLLFIRNHPEIRSCQIERNVGYYGRHLASMRDGFWTSESVRTNKRGRDSFKLRHVRQASGNFYGIY